MVRLLPRVWLVSIRFEVRGGSRHKFARMSGVMFVSIRFEVRGGSRRTRSTGGSGRSKFQSALRFAVVPDFLTPIGVTVPIIVSIRFEVRGGSRQRLSQIVQSAHNYVSIRFEVRGGFRPYPLARRPDKPCCGGFTHHPSSPPPTSGQNLPSEGQNP